MPQQPNASVENNFTGGLKTEFTGLNFPENAATDTDNCVYTLIGEVERRAGFDFETNRALKSITRTSNSISSFKWTNVGGDGSTQIIVIQAGINLYFFRSTDATIASPLSTTLLVSTIDLTPYYTGTGTLAQRQCQYASGNGYLFVFHPYIKPIYISYSAGTLTATGINLQIRDFAGIAETSVVTQTRPAALTAEHTYNLTNQGWGSAAAWSASSTSTVTSGTGSKTFTVAAGLSATPGQQVIVKTNSVYTITMAGTVTSYSGTTLTLNISSVDYSGISTSPWSITPINLGLLNTWHTAEGNYPSNADVWWRFKNTSGVFDPATTQPNVTLGTGPAPQGFYILDAFNQDRSSISSIAGLTAVTTTLRPKTGTWFQGRVWYSGVDSSQAATGDASYYTWSETLYFSQIVTTTAQFGMCYQNNDPTSEDLFDLLPTDGGTITIQGSGAIYRLFPVQNGLLVFAANGIWFITGSQGIGFSANDYTITKISEVHCISPYSFVNVLGWPMFWNEEGIYAVSPSQQGGGLVVNNLCYGTILSYYASIPIESKKYAKGVYNPITFVITWLYSSVAPADINARHVFDKMLNFNTSNKAFYPYSIGATTPQIHEIIYVDSPGGSTGPSPTNKFLTSYSSSQMSFSEEFDETHWKDFYSYDSAGVDYTSYFITGYRLHGKALTKWQPIYVQMYSNDSVNNSYKINGIWDYARSGNSGRYSNMQLITNTAGNFNTLYRRHKIRGRGMSLQIQVQSVTGLPFSIMGWSSMEAINAGM